MGYAIIRSGGKQHRVEPGAVIRVESLAGDPGATVDLPEVLVAASDGDVRVGRPLLSGVKVTARILTQGKARKILVFHKKRRKNQRRHRGHRQRVTTLQVLEIEG